MRSLRNKGRSNSDGEVSSQDGYSEQDNGWGEYEFQSDPIEKRRRRDQSRYIEIANNKLTLSSTFKRYNINFEEHPYTTSGWSHKCICPFPDHQEKTASFSYNPSLDRFWCFGCSRGGRSIQFISIMEDIPQIKVAKNCLGHLIDFDDNDLDDFGLEEKRKVTKLLFDYADFLREFKEKNDFGQASKYADNVGWNLDLYLRKNAIKGSIVAEDLEVRIEKIKEYLVAFGDSDE